MAKNFLYFQPEYFSKFKCDGSKCNNNCCEREWGIDIDKTTYEKYSHLQPESASRELIKHITYDSDNNRYLITKRPCPFLTEKKLCRLQLEHGESFLSDTCTIYPRRILDFGYFFERSLSLTCPVVAEMILFTKEPLSFEFVEVPEKIHQLNRKSKILKCNIPEDFVQHVVEIQIAMISILQERTLTIDQRLIVIGFLIDYIDEMTNKKTFTQEEVTTLHENLVKVVSTYESKKFLAEQAPIMIQSINFDEKNFVGLILKIFENLYGGWNLGDNRKFVDAVVKVLKIRTDKNNNVSITQVADNYNRLADDRKKFLARYSNFFENYLVNKIFYNTYPWQADNNSITDNFAVFLITYKAFELLLFCATMTGLDSRNDLLKLVDFFSSQIENTELFYKKISEEAKNIGDLFTVMEFLLNGR